MMLRNVTSVALFDSAPAAGGPTFTEFTLDCGHRARRSGDVTHRKRVLCGTCSASVGEETQRAMGRGLSV